MQTTEITLRECLNMVFETGGIHNVTSKLYEKYYTKNDSKQAVCERYTGVMQDLLQLNISKNNSDKIVVREYVMHTTTSSDKYVQENTVHVGLRDESNADYSIDLVPWNEIIDLKVLNETDLDMHHVIACILWEITFWGFTHKEINKQIKKLKKSIDDIESGKTKLIEWDDALKQLAVDK